MTPKVMIPGMKYWSNLSPVGSGRPLSIEAKMTRNMHRHEEGEEGTDGVTPVRELLVLELARDDPSDSSLADPRP